MCGKKKREFAELLKSLRMALQEIRDKAKTSQKPISPKNPRA